MTEQKVQSGNPTDNSTRGLDLRDQLRSVLEEHSEELLDAAIKKAKAGNTTLLKTLIRHFIAPAKRRAMNTRQKRILIGVAVTLTGMLLYPPIRISGIPNVAGGRNPGVTHGYDWLLTNIWGSVEIDLLLTQFFVVGVVAAIAYILCADKKQYHP